MGGNGDGIAALCSVMYRFEPSPARATSPGAGESATSGRRRVVAAAEDGGDNVGNRREVGAFAQFPCEPVPVELMSYGVHQLCEHEPDVVLLERAPGLVEHLRRRVVDVGDRGGV